MTAIEPAGTEKPGMRAKLVEEYGILAQLHGLQGPILEITMGTRHTAIVGAPSFAGFERHVLLPGESGEEAGTHFHKGHANDMSQLFDDACFATVLWDRGLERDAHDRGDGGGELDIGDRLPLGVRGPRRSGRVARRRRSVAVRA